MHRCFRARGCGTAVRKITFWNGGHSLWLVFVLVGHCRSGCAGAHSRIKGATDMIRRLVLLFLLFGLTGPTVVEAQRSPRLSRRVTRDSQEAEVFFGTLDAIRDYALETRGDSLLWEMAIDGLIKELGDPYATVLSPAEVAAFEEQSTGDYAGIGIAISELNGSVTITTVFGGTPAENAGLLVGDRIIGVNSDEGDGWSVDEASSRIRGQPGTSVVVYISRDGIAQPIPFDIERDEVHIPAVRYQQIFEDISYIVLDRVTRNSAAEVDSVLTEIGDSRGIVFDLRRNPGGYLDEALNLSDLFLDRGSVLVTTKSRTRGSSGDLREESARARVTPRVSDLPIVILVDQYSASAAEIVAGSLQDHDRALVLGERTFGKGLVQSVIPLPEGRLIRITSGEWYTPQGRSLHRPRDNDGRVIAPDSIPEFVSMGGRRLLGGGGVFPDLEILSDTLSSGEQAFLNATVEAGFPLQTRIQEAALAAVQQARDAPDGEQPEFPSEVLPNLFASIMEEGSPAELTQEAMDYITWRAEVVFHQRLGQVGRGLEIQSERDTVLQTAVRFLQSVDDQAGLFALALAENEARAEVVDAGSPGSAQ